MTEVQQSSDTHDWGNAKGIADEAHFDEFVQRCGGVRVDSVIRNPTFQNADYWFEKPKVLVELKILETEFAKSPEFHGKLTILLSEFRDELGPGPFAGKPIPPHVWGKIYALMVPPIARIMKKAN